MKLPHTLLEYIKSWGCISILLIPPLIVLLSTLHPLMAGLVAVFTFVICVIVAYRSVVHTTIDRFSSNLVTVSNICEFLDSISNKLIALSHPNVFFGLTVTISALWYATMLVPVNIEVKLVLIEVLFYHVLLVISLVFFRKVKRLEMDPNASSKMKHHSGEDAQAMFSVTHHYQHHFACFDLVATAGNQWYFLAFLAMHLWYAMYTVNLALTSICTPRMYLNWFLLPHDCANVFADFQHSWTFVASILWLICQIIPLVIFLFQLARTVCRPHSSVSIA